MQHTHRLAYLAGHMLVDLPEGRFLVDTGSAASFGDSGTATYGGRTVEIPRRAHGVSLSEIAGLGLEARIGARLRGVLGMDILGTEPVLWDGERGRAIVRPPAPAPTSVRVPFVRDDGTGVPVLDALVGTRMLRLAFDTGAQFGYLAEPPERWSSESAVAAEEFDDFHPTLGAIRSPSVKYPVVLGASTGPTVRVRERFGFHGPLASGVLGPRRLDGILGCSWMPNRPVWFMPAESLLRVG